MKVAVMQPYFFSYLGCFSLIHSVNHFMFSISNNTKKVLKSEGISSATSVTMEGFKGNN